MNFSKRLRAEGKGFRLADRDPKFHGDLSRESAEALQAAQLVELQSFQDRLYADDTHSVLLVLQGMDAAGKDGIIKHVMSGLNPQGCHVVSFKAPSETELDHDFLWRSNLHLPERGQIGVFNRSYYEEVLNVRVHAQILAGQKLPPALVTKNIWKERYEDINAAERHLVRNGTRIVKVFLNVSKEEQRRRFLDRLEDKKKNWKFRAADLKERDYWSDYMKAYQEMIQATSTKWAPWHVVPADHKWFSRLAVADLLIDAMAGMKLAYPQVSPPEKKELEVLRRRMMREKRGKA